MYNAMNFIYFSLLCVLRPFITDANGNFESTYPHMSEYFTDKIDPVANCPNFDCSLSTLDSVQIDTILNEENKRRNDYAIAKNISGLYRVYWSDSLAKFARKKAQLCLPPTFDGSEEKYFIYDGGDTLQKIFHPRSPILLLPAKIQIVSGMREESITSTQFNSIMFKAKLLDYYVSLFNSREANFELRGGTTLMGCGYIVQQTNSTITDRLLCAYGMLYGGDDDYVLQTGRPCSKCDYYDTESKYSDPRILARDRLEKWNCDYMYTSLCSDLNKLSITKYKNSKLDCTDPFYGLRDEYMPEKQVVSEPEPATQPPPTKPPEPVPIPCWSIMVPMSAIIIGLIGVCGFHVVTSVLTYRKAKQKAVSK